MVLVYKDIVVTYNSYVHISLQLVMEYCLGSASDIIEGKHTKL